MIQIDGYTTKKAGGAGVVLISLEGEILKYAIRLEFPSTNNEAEYEALLMGLSLARALEANTLIIQADSACSWPSKRRLCSKGRKNAKVLEDRPRIPTVFR